MNDEQMLVMLKVDLQLTTTAYDTRLQMMMDAAKAEIKREGVTNLNTASSISDANLVIMYTAWLWRKRETMEGMPRMVRWALNNRIMELKMK